MSTAKTTTDERKLQQFIAQSDVMKNMFTNPNNSVKIQVGDYGAVDRNTGVFQREGNLYELMATLANKERQSHPEGGYTIDQDALVKNTGAGKGPIDIKGSDLFKDSDPTHFAKNMYKDKYGLDVEKLRPENIPTEEKHTFLASCFDPSIAQVERPVIFQFISGNPI
ncbi:hypothetical protein BDQ17DRAFT_1421258 [Cyathus striatus]|nr:hypothetical protein BDQ17DRAFT_1421258 [Cyathus striatus]